MCGVGGYLAWRIRIFKHKEQHIRKCEDKSGRTVH